MKIALTSDIHLEFGDWYPVNPDNADVLILSGDIMVASPIRFESYIKKRFIDFLENCSKEYPETIFIMGNHEHYNGDFQQTPIILRAECERYNIRFLNNEATTIGDITFIGTTLWTDMNKDNSGLSVYHASRMMNDFRIISNSNHPVDPSKRNSCSKFTPQDSIEEHKKSLQYIESVVKDQPNKKFIVVGHHAPSFLSIHEKYKDDSLNMNGFFVSDLSEFILNYPQIKLWTHGHTHHPFDYMIGETRVVCNPRGYVYRERQSNDIEPYLPKTIEV